MIDLDTTRFAPDVVSLLMLRGAELPPLQWQKKPVQVAKELLNRVSEDKVLLRLNTLADDAMSAAIRAMLYLWNGFPAECSMYAQVAPQTERDYLGSVCERQAGHPVEAKASLRLIGQHPIHDTLAAFALETVGLGSDPALNRFKQMLELGEAWEPFAFVDLFEQARVGKLSNATEQAVRRIQCREFELLFIHCYNAAAGTDIPYRSSTKTAAPRTRQPRPARHKRPTRPQTERPKTEQTQKELKPVGLPGPSLVPKGPRVGVHCPKCQILIVLPEARRGTKEKCTKCGAVFLIPQKKALAHSSERT